MPTPTIRQALAGWLTSLSSLTAIVGNRIYYTQPSQANLYPCLVLEITGRKFGHNLSGADGSSFPVVQLTALAYYQSQCESIAEVLRNNFDGFRGNQPPTGPPYVPILRCLLGDEADGISQPVDGSDDEIYQIAVEYEIAHRIALPTSVTQTDV